MGYPEPHRSFDPRLDPHRTRTADLSRKGNKDIPVVKEEERRQTRTLRKRDGSRGEIAEVQIRLPRRKRCILGLREGR